MVEGTTEFLGNIKGPKGDKGDMGNGIAQIERTEGTGAAGSYDTYTISYTDGGSDTLRIYNGKDGEGSGDMLMAVYDADGRAEDIFKYVDEHKNDKENPHEVTAEQAGAVPAARTVNGHALSGDITLSAADVGAQAAITGGASTITSSNLTASRALVSDASGKVAVSGVTSTQLGYLSGVTSAIQTQLNAKAASGAAVTMTALWSGTATSGTVTIASPSGYKLLLVLGVGKAKGDGSVGWFGNIVQASTAISFALIGASYTNLTISGTSMTISQWDTNAPNVRYLYGIK